MTLRRITPVHMVAPKGDDEAAVRTRLKILLQLAIAIGRRTGRLRSSYGPDEEQEPLVGGSQSAEAENAMEVREHGENQEVRPEMSRGEGNPV
jgi:hypothetical protein